MQSQGGFSERFCCHCCHCCVEVIHGCWPAMCQMCSITSPSTAAVSTGTQPKIAQRMQYRFWLIQDLLLHYVAAGDVHCVSRQQLLRALRVVSVHALGPVGHDAVVSNVTPCCFHRQECCVSGDANIKNILGLQADSCTAAVPQHSVGAVVGSLQHNTYWRVFRHI